MTETELAIVIRAYNEAQGALNAVGSQLDTLAGRVEAFGKSSRGTFAAFGLAGIEAGAASAAMLAPVYKGIEAAASLDGMIAHVSTALMGEANASAKANEVREHAIALSNHSALSAEEEAQAFYLAYSTGMTYTQALAAMEKGTELVVGTTENAREAQAAMGATTRELATIFFNFGDKLKNPSEQMAAFTDTMAKLQTKYAFRDITEVTYALAASAQNMKTLGIGFNEGAAALGVLSAAGFHGAEAGYGLKAVVDAFSSNDKLRPFMVRTAEGHLMLRESIIRLRDAYGYLPDIEQARALGRLGFGGGDIGQIKALMANVETFGTVEADIMNSRGAAHAAFALRSVAADEQMVQAQNALRNSWEAFGHQLIPIELAALHAAQAFLGWASGMMAAHPQLTKFVGVALIAGGVITGLAAVFLGALGSLALFAGAIGTTVLGAAAWIAAGAGIVAAIAAAIAALVTFRPHFLRAGVDFMKALAEGIWSAITAPVHAAEAVAAAIGRFFKGHSPPEIGPLHDINRVTVPQMLAAGINNTAMEAALAAQGSAALMSRHLAGTSGGGTRAAFTRGGAPVTLNFSPRIEINAGPGTDLRALEAMMDRWARRSGRMLLEVLQEAHASQDRANYS